MAIQAKIWTQLLGRRSYPKGAGHYNHKQILIQYRRVLVCGNNDLPLRDPEAYCHSCVHIFFVLQELPSNDIPASKQSIYRVMNGIRGSNNFVA